MAQKQNHHKVQIGRKLIINSRINLDLWNLAKVNGNLSNAMHATHISDNSQFSYHRVKYNDHEDASEKP